jgi:capsular polysaccharide transport system permease protein
VAVVDASLAQSFAAQRRVIGALLLREVITRYGRHNIGVLWLIAEPMLFTLGIAALWTFARLHTLSNIPIIAFAVTGYSTVLLWRNAATRCAKAIEPNLSLMYHRNVRVMDIFISRVLLEIVGATASFAFMTVSLAAMGVMPWPHDLAVAVAGWLLLCWFAVALGFLVGALSERSEMFDRLWHVVTYLLFPISGAAFMAHWLPPGAREAVLWLPMVHATEFIRHGFFGPIVPTYEDPVYFACANLVLTLVGLALVRQAEARVQPE